MAILARIATAIVGLGIGLGGTILWKTAALRRAKWVFAGLAAYGVAALAHATATGVSLRDVLSGKGLLQSLPYPLQAAIIGCLVVLPLGWIASLLRAAVPTLHEKPLRRHLYDAVTLTTCVALVAGSFPYDGMGKRMSPKERVALLDQSLRALEDGQREFPRDTWDPDYVVKAAGRDPRRLFQWVRDNTYWIPYHGVLRGPVGVLMDRQGNSLDRALLLAKLLERAGYSVRMAHGALASDQAIELVPMLDARRVSALTRPTPVQPTAAPIHLAAKQYGMNDAAVNGDLQSQQELFSRAVAELHTRVTDQAARLLKLARSQGSREAWSRSLSSAVDALSDHWWVQLEYGEKWVDLDLLAGEPGTALVAATETDAIKDLPSGLHHTITLRVIAEQWAGGTLREHKALEQVLRPSDLYGHSVMLQFWPGEWFETDNASSRHSRAGAIAQDKWYALLAVDRNPLAVGLLVDNGDDPNAPDAAVKGGEMGGFAGAFSSTMGLDQKKENRQLSAVWIEYQIHVPGEEPHTIRRTVFDLLGPAARTAPSPGLALNDSKRLERSLALTMQTEILPISCGLSPEFVTALVAQNVRTNRDLFAYFLKGDLPKGTQDAEHLFDRSQPPLSTLYGLALARLELSEKSQVFINRPNILTRHLYAAPSGNGIALLDATDIVANEVGVSLSARDPFAARLSQGVLDTNAESLFRPGMSVSVGDAFAGADSWKAFTSGEDTQDLGTLGLPDDLRRRIANDLNGGYSVVAPQRVLRTRAGEFSGWWRIDPVTGDALGMDSNGWGATMPERSAKEAWWRPIYALAKVKLATFTVAFAANYGWCVTPLVIKHFEDSAKPQAWGIAGSEVKPLQHNLGIWEGAIKPSVGECVGDSIFIAGITAWLLPVGVHEEGETPPGQSEPDAPPPPKRPDTLPDNPPGGKKPGDKPSGNGNPDPDSPPNGDPNSNKPPDKQPDKPPKKDDPCKDTEPGEPPDAPPEPEGAGSLKQQLLDAERNVYTARVAYKQATEAAMEALGAEYRYKAGPEWRGGAPFDPAKYQELQNIAAREDQIANQRFQELQQAERELKSVQDAVKKANRRPQQSGLGCFGGNKPVVGSGDPGGKPGPITSLDPSLYQAGQPGNTDSGLGPNYSDPTTDPNGPPTIPDPRTQIPGDANNPYGATQPGDNPYAKTQPGNTPGQTPSGAPPPNTPPPAPSQQSWDGKLCPYCSTAIPTYPDSASDSQSQSSPQKSGSTPSPGAKTLAGVNGATNALGGSK